MSRPVDHVDLAVAARKAPKSAGRLRRLIGVSLRMVWAADRRLFTLTGVLRLSGALVLAGQVLAIRLVLDAILDVSEGDASAGAVLVPVALLALVSGFTSMSTAIQGHLQRLLAELVVRATWQRLLRVAGAVELRSFELPGFYDRLQRVQTNTLSRPFQLTQGLLALIGGTVAVLGLTAAVVSFEPLLLPLLALAGVPVFFSSRAESRLEFDFTVRQTPKLRLRQYLSMVQTGRDEAKEVRAFALSDMLRSRFDGVYGEYVDDLRRHVRRRTALSLAGNLASSVMLALTLFALVWLVSLGRVGLAEAGAAIVAVRLLATQLNLTLAGAQQIFESGLFLDDLEDFAASVPSTPEGDDGRAAPAGFDRLDVDSITFSYPGSEQPALREVSLQLRSGEVIALVGENGSGKTTLAKVLAALYEPDSGSVRWDGVDVRGYAPKDLRRRIAVIFQDFVRYHLTARENIALGRGDIPADPDAVAAAAHRAGIAAAIERLPLGYDTVLSKWFKDGQDLSGGQWQRLALARAFYRDAPFVILDEPSASLDARAEHALFGSLKELLAGRTVLYISHRFSTVRSADRIYVLHAGEVVEQGSHDELMALDGRYAELFRLQASSYLQPATSSPPPG